MPGLQIEVKEIAAPPQLVSVTDNARNSLLCKWIRFPVLHLLTPCAAAATGSAENMRWPRGAPQS